MAILRSPVTLGILAFTVLFIALGWVLPTTCVDGWQSPSIGIQGACSSHGGVAESRDVLRIALSVVAALAVAVALVLLRRKSAAAPAIPSRPTLTVPNCEVCGAPMRLVTASGGGDRYVWSCSRAGAEHPTRPVADAVAR